jgi:hypothetical protein
VPQTSNLGHYERVSDEMFSEDSPVSAGQVWLLRNNLLHMRDQFSKTIFSWSRFNAFSENDLACSDGADAGERAVLPLPFVHTWLAEDAPCSLDYKIRVVNTQASKAANVRIRVIPHFIPGTAIPFAAGDAAADDLAFIDTEQDQSSPFVATFDGQQFLTTDAARSLAAQLRPWDVGTHFGIEELDQQFPATYVHMMRLEIIVTSADNSVYRIAQNFLREFV